MCSSEHVMKAMKIFSWTAEWQRMANGWTGQNRIVSMSISDTCYTYLCSIPNKILDPK